MFVVVCLRKAEAFVVQVGRTGFESVKEAMAYGPFDLPSEAATEVDELVAMGCDGPHVVAKIEAPYAGHVAGDKGPGATGLFK